MIPAPGRDMEREIAKSLVAALEVALAAGGAPAELRAARDAAQLLELPGLDHLIAALAPHARQPWPAEIAPVVERLRRVCARAVAAEGLLGFRRSDADFRGLAEEIVAMEWGALPSQGGAAGPSVPTVGAAEMLSDVLLAGDESASVARRVRLTMPVAAAVRAALDWLAGREGGRQPIELSQDASALEIRCGLRDVRGVPAAHEVLAGVDGNLGPRLAAEPGEGSWIIRVPAFSERPAYVMLEQGTLRIAVPWHAVLKVQVAPREAIGTRAARLGMRVLPPVSPLAGRGSESPVVIVAHGLKRAWMVADRLVWRLPADPCEPDERILKAGLGAAVCTDEGEVYALLEPRRLLEGTGLPALPTIPARPAEASEARQPDARPSAAATPAQAAPVVPRSIEILDERWVTPLAAPEAAAPPASAHSPAEKRAARTPATEAPRQAQTPAGATAKLEPADGQTPAPSGAPGEPAPARERGVEARLAHRALVAEDSITVRIFFTRLLEQQGFEVVAVERAADLEAALGAGPFELACVDIELPDALGADLLRRVRDRLPEGTPLVALVRDEHDVTEARAAGVWRTLMKPVEPGALRRLLARLRLEERAS